MASDRQSAADHPVSAALLQRDEDTLLSAPLVLRELRRAQGRPVSTAVVLGETLHSLAQPLTPQEWYEWCIQEGEFNTAKRLQPHVEGVSPTDLIQMQRERREKLREKVASLQALIGKQAPVLGANADAANTMIDEALQLSVEGWFDLADEHLKLIRELLTESINTALDERRQWFRQTQKTIDELRAAIIDHEQELLEHNTYDLMWELLHYADKVSVGRGHDLDLIEQIRDSVQTLFQGGQADARLVQTLRDQFQTLPVVQPLEASASPLLTLPDDGGRARVPVSSSLLNQRERAVLAGAIGPGLDVIEMNLARTASLPPPPNKEEAARLYQEAMKAYRQTHSETKTKLRAGGSEGARLAAGDADLRARDLEETARRLLSYLGGKRKTVATSEVNDLRGLVAAATNLRAWSLLIQGAWASAGLYYRLLLRIPRSRLGDVNLREAVFHYFAAFLRQEPAPELQASATTGGRIAERYRGDDSVAPELHAALMEMLAPLGREARGQFERAALALWQLGKESPGLRQQLLTVLDNLESATLREGLLEGFNQLSHQLQGPVLPELRPMAEALIDRGVALDAEREERLRQLQQKSLAAQTLAEVEALVAELSAYPLWSAADGQVLTALKAITKAMSGYFDPQLTFGDRDPVAREIQQRADEAERIMVANPTRWGVRYLGHILANLRGQVEIEHFQLQQTARPRLEVVAVHSEWRRDGRYYCHLQVTNVGGMRADDVTLWVTESPSGEYEFAQEEQRLGTLHPDRPAFALVAIRPAFAEGQDAFTLSVQVVFAVPGQATRETRRLPLRVEIVAAGQPPSPAFVENPFVVGSPVEDPVLFKGRRALIAELAAVVSNPAQAGSVVLFGQKRSGKTSILIHLAHHLEQATPRLVIPVRLSLDEVLTGLSRDMERATLQLLYAFCLKIEATCQTLNGQGDWQIAVEPISEAELERMPGAGVQFTSYLRRFKEHNPHYRLLLMLDEFTGLMQRIDEAVIDGDIMRLFKAQIDSHLMSFVICGLNEVLPAIDRYANQLAASKVSQVDYLSETATAELIDDPIRLPDGRSRFYSPHELREVFNLTAGNPYYTQAFGRELVNYLNLHGNERVTMADVPRVVARMIEGPDRLAPTAFDNLYRYTPGPDKPRDVILEGLIVHLMAYETSSKDYVQSSALYARMREFVAEDEFVAALERLKRNQTIVEEVHDTLRRRGDLAGLRAPNYRLRVDLFRRWLVANYPMDDLVLRDFAGRLDA